MEIKDILKNRRLELNLTQLDIAKAVGVSEATISRWESGNIANMKRSRIAALAKILQIKPNVIMGLEEEPSSPLPHNLIPLTFKRVPVLGSIACGEPIFAEQSEGVYVDTDSDSDADFALVCRGDSMIGDDIRDGDYVMIRRQEMVDNGEIACVLIGDEATLKHFYFNDGVVTLTAANQKYPPMVFSGHDIDTIRILGKAVGLTRFF